MDSMRSLNTSLPRSPKRTSTQPPEELLQAFKTAALSVTNLYKTSATQEARARQNGYQEALDDLLAFLDKEHLGLGDGEGWKVRRWATERLDGNTAGAAGSESDEERAETEKSARSSSPTVQDRSNRETLRSRHHLSSTSPTRVTSAPAVPQPPTSIPAAAAPEIFSFRSVSTPNPYPSDVDMAATEPAVTSTSQPDVQNITPIPNPASAAAAAAAVRVEVVPRGPRTPHRNGNHTGRHGARTAVAMGRRSLGSGAGSKRRFDFNDYFGLGDLGDGRDGAGGGGGGGGKRGRLN
ncbi:MAG: hypothetical protein Q9219_004218 [cf. Caloplaca sp. 3 TL-2023]